jgi:hypothetical protein
MTEMFKEEQMQEEAACEETVEETVAEEATEAETEAAEETAEAVETPAEDPEEEAWSMKYMRLMADFQNHKKRTEKEKSDIVLCGYFTENGTALKKVCYVGDKENLDFKELKAKDLIDPAWNKLYKTDFLKNTKVKFPVGEYYEDTFFNLSILPFNPKITVCDECFYHYVLNMGSITRRYNKEKLPLIKDRARLLKSVTKGIENYCDFYFIKCVFSAFIDMFLSLSKEEIKKQIREEISKDEFKNCAKNAFYTGKTSRVIIKTAQSGRVGAVYNFCKTSFFLKYKMQKTFLRVKNK